MESHIFKIDSKIQSIAESKISNSAYTNAKYRFVTRLNAEFYQTDTLDVKINSDSSNLWAWYSWHNDTLTLSGNSGDLTSTGFIVDIINDSTAEFYHNKCAHTSYQYKLHLSDTFEVCAKVPCIYSELIISKMPDSTKDDLIFGYVNFKSIDYYAKDNDQPIKMRKNMSFYFRATSFDFYGKRFATK